MLIVWLLLIIGFIVLATAKLKWHPFLVLLAAALLAALCYQLPIGDVAKIMSDGFGKLMGYIGLVIVFGTIIGVILERTGAALVMAQTVVRLIGKRFPTLAMSIVGAMVSIPVFCDSGFVILNSLKESLAKNLNVSPVAMSVALATGLFATHNLVPPTPGPIAAAGGVGLENQLGLVIGVGLVVSIVPVLIGWLWANRFVAQLPEGEDPIADMLHHDDEKAQQILTSYGELPSPVMAFLPILLPIVLICLASIATFPSHPFGAIDEPNLFLAVLLFAGKPLIALIIGFLASLFLLHGKDKTQAVGDAVSEGLTIAAPILLITGAGGTFGAVLKASPVGDYLGQVLSGFGLGIFMPFVVAAALKSAQGSSTVALVTTASLVQPLLATIGLESEMARVLVVMAIGAGAMTVSHANDSFFWVVSQFSRMSTPQAYRSFTTATALQGVATMIVVWLLSLVLV